MFGLGFTEIILIAIVALLFIGPDKLPDTMRQIARTFGKIKRAFEDTKSTIQQELNIEELRQEALAYRREIEKAKEDLSAFKNVANKEVNEIKKAAALESFEPKDINDDIDLWDELEEAEKEFEELERDKPKKKPAKAPDPYAKSNHEEQIEKLKAQNEESSQEDSQEEPQTLQFKHLKSQG